MGLILLGAGCTGTGQNQNRNGQQNVQPNTSKGLPADNNVQTQTNNTTQTSATSFTMGDVAKHNSANSCWTVVDGKVYDVTAEENKHPGGRQAILAMCGVDASGAFNNQHGGQRKPEQDLAGLQIGTLK